MGSTEFVSCGRVGRAVGLKGENAVFWNSGQSPVELGGELFIPDKKTQDHKSYRIAALRTQGRFDVVRFDGISDRTGAESLRGSEIYLPEDRLPRLPAGEYYCYQILGLRVATEDGRELGKIVRIFTAGENDVYEVLPEDAARGQEVLIPAIADIVLSIDIEKGRVIVRPMEGMIE
ncbi:MAG: ribosome maturation factor RimM [bacterium]